MAEFAAAALAATAATAGATTAGAAGVSAAAAGVAGTAAATGAIASGAAGVSAAAAGAGASILGSFATASTVASILGGTATVASVLAAQRAGEEKGRSLDLAAGDAELEGQMATNAGIERRSSLRRQLIASVGERDVATAASGLDLSFGTPAQARSEATRDAENALSTDMTNENLKRQRLAERAGSLRAMAAEARGGALARSAALALGQTAQMVRRG